MRLAPYETQDEEKIRGLYVDLGRTTGQPQDVSIRDARLALTPLESTLKILAPSQTSLEDLASWDELSEEIERVRKEYIGQAR